MKYTSSEYTVFHLDIHLAFASSESSENPSSYCILPSLNFPTRLLSLCLQTGVGRQRVPLLRRNICLFVVYVLVRISSVAVWLMLIVRLLSPPSAGSSRYIDTVSRWNFTGRYFAVILIALGVGIFLVYSQTLPVRRYLNRSTGLSRANATVRVPAKKPRSVFVLGTNGSLERQICRQWLCFYHF